ncbi:class F sortase [Streptacidiphilus cavernicola]|uniref:Class F sortase n=1 Tax=Streptacidiphilus cavernicola TaxID=3342716 RepID=A0ABV6VPQ9_9ACTN
MLVLAGTASAVVGAVGLGASLEHRAGPSSNLAPLAAAAPGAALGPIVAQPSPPPAGTAAHPVEVSIPALKVHASTESLGLTATGALDVPANPDQVGWFDAGPVPGRAGPAVLVGHVDSSSGPAVFADLRLIRIGDIVVVTLSGGGTVRFQVTSVAHYPKDAFPTAAVYGARPDPELRLITCGGAFTDQEYQDNVVVYARLAPSG